LLCGPSVYASAEVRDMLAVFTDLFLLVISIYVFKLQYLLAITCQPNDRDGQLKALNTLGGGTIRVNLVSSLT